MTERNKYVDAASEKLTDGEMVERVAHPTHSTTEHAGEAGEHRDEQTSPTPEQSP